MKALAKMKTMNITKKLNYAKKPSLIIGETVIEVNNKASTILKAMDLFEDLSPSDMPQVASLLFGEEGSKKLDDLDLSFDDYLTVITSAVELVTGKEEGEDPTRTTT